MERDWIHDVLAIAILSDGSGKEIRFTSRFQPEVERAVQESHV